MKNLLLFIFGSQCFFRTHMDSVLSNTCFNNLNGISNLTSFAYNLYLYSILIIILLLSVCYFSNDLNPALIFIKGDGEEWNKSRVNRVSKTIIKNIKRVIPEKPEMNVSEYIEHIYRWFKHNHHLIKVRNLSTSKDLRLVFLFGPLPKLIFKISTTLLFKSIMRWVLEFLYTAYINKTIKFLHRYLTIEVLEIDKNNRHIRLKKKYSNDNSLSN